MKLSKAIELLQQDIDDPGSVDIMDVNEAERLGIEALKTIKAERTIYGFKRQFRLPGETEE